MCKITCTLCQLSISKQLEQRSVWPKWERAAVSDSYVYIKYIIYNTYIILYNVSIEIVKVSKCPSGKALHAALEPFLPDAKHFFCEARTLELESPTATNHYRHYHHKEVFEMPKNHQVSPSANEFTTVSILKCVVVICCKHWLTCVNIKPQYLTVIYDMLQHNKRNVHCIY